MGLAFGVGLEGAGGGQGGSAACWPRPLLGGLSSLQHPRGSVGLTSTRARQPPSGRAVRTTARHTHLPGDPGLTPPSLGFWPWLLPIPRGLRLPVHPPGTGTGQPHGKPRSGPQSKRGPADGKVSTAEAALDGPLSSGGCPRVLTEVATLPPAPQPGLSKRRAPPRQVECSTATHLKGLRPSPGGAEPVSTFLPLS